MQLIYLDIWKHEIISHFSLNFFTKIYRDKTISSILNKKQNTYFTSIIFISQNAMTNIQILLRQKKMANIEITFSDNIFFFVGTMQKICEWIESSPYVSSDKPTKMFQLFHFFTFPPNNDINGSMHYIIKVKMTYKEYIILYLLFKHTNVSFYFLFCWFKLTKSSRISSA